MLSLPHACLMLVHRGSGAFLGAAFLICRQQMDGNDFDALDLKMPTLLGAAFESLLGRHLAPCLGIPVEAVRGQMLLMVGGSVRRSRMCGMFYNQTPRQAGFVQVPFAGCTEDEDQRGRRFAPLWNLQKSGPTPYATTPAAMEQVARTQMRDFPTGQGIVCGGRLLVTELTRDTITTTSQCSVEDGSGMRNSLHPILPPPARETGAGHAVMFGKL